MKQSLFMMSVVIGMTALGCGSQKDSAALDGQNVTGSPGGSSGSGGGYKSFPQPAGTVAANFMVDDSANAVYGNGDLVWKGSLKYACDASVTNCTFDAANRTAVLDPTWGGPYVSLYDDGPWDKCSEKGCGHEPSGAKAGDYKWGVTIFVTPDASKDLQFEYGLVDNSVPNSWIWGDPNGKFTVPVGAKAAIDAPGKTFPKFGKTDLKLTLDKNTLDETNVDPTTGRPIAWDTSKVSIKGSSVAWAEIPLKFDENGIATYVQSQHTGPGSEMPHYGLLAPSSDPNFGEAQWTWVLGGKEYKDKNGSGSHVGVKAFTPT
jgi:hypothetical protein